MTYVSHLCHGRQAECWIRACPSQELTQMKISLDCRYCHQNRSSKSGWFKDIPSLSNRYQLKGYDIHVLFFRFFLVFLFVLFFVFSLKKGHQKVDERMYDIHSISDRYQLKAYAETPRISIQVAVSRVPFNRSFFEVMLQQSSPSINSWVRKFIDSSAMLCRPIPIVDKPLNCYCYYTKIFDC